MTVTIDKAGRVVLPKTLRDEMNLNAGDSLEVEPEGDHVLLRPVRATSPLKRERGVWVFRSGNGISAESTDAVLGKLRGSRDADNRADNSGQP